MHAIQSDSQFEELKQIAKYHSVHLFMNVSGMLVAGIGIVVFVALYFILPHMVYSKSIVISFILAIISGLSIYYKVYKAMVAMIVIISMTVLNNGIVVRNALTRNHFDGLQPLLISIVQLFIILLVLLITSYSFQKWCQFTPDQLLYSWLKQEVNYIKRRESVRNQSVIRFSISVGKHRVQWRGRLYPHSVLLVSGTTILLIERPKFIIHQDHSSVWKKIRQFFVTDFTIDGIKKYGSIDKVSYQRYSEWQEMAQQSDDHWWVPWS